MSRRKNATDRARTERNSALEQIQACIQLYYKTSSSGVSWKLPRFSRYTQETARDAEAAANALLAWTNEQGVTGRGHVRVQVNVDMLRLRNASALYADAKPKSERMALLQTEIQSLQAIQVGLGPCITSRYIAGQYWVPTIW